MTSRILPREEWARLDGTLLWPAAASFDPASIVMVVEDEDRIVGCAAYYPVWHLDGVWMAPDAKKVSVGRRLWHAIRRVARECKITAAWAMAASPSSQKLVASCGPTLHLDCHHYEIDLRAHNG